MAIVRTVSQLEWCTWMEAARAAFAKSTPPEQVSRPGEQCNCAHHDKSTQQPPSGAMTIERAREIAHDLAAYADKEEIAQALVNADRAAEIRALESARPWLRRTVEAHEWIERRLKEIDANRTRDITKAEKDRLD